MSGLMTDKLDQLFKALAENAPITKDLIIQARQEYTKLRVTAQNGEKRENSAARNGGKQAGDKDAVCSKCYEIANSHKELVAEIRQLQAEVDLKSKLCKDLQEQLRRRQIDNALQSEQTRIADLNDPNRALKVGEMYAQLYDTQWIEAYEYLDNIINLREDKILETLQRIIRAAFKFCKDIARAQWLNLSGEITCPLSTWTENKRMLWLENGSEVSSKMAEITRKYRKSSSTECIPNLQKIFSDVVLPTFFDGNEYKNEYVIRYADKSVAVSWYMCIQEPQMALVSKIIRKSDFDSNLFRPYTKSGDKYDYLVWPALLLHENGPIVEKGVAQPLDSAISPLSLRSRKTPMGPTSPINATIKRADSNNAALKGTPWGSQMFVSNDPNAPSPSIDLPKTPRSVRSQNDLIRGTPNQAPIVSYPASPGTFDKNDVLTGTWKKTGK